MQIPASTVSLTVQGNLQQLEKFYRSIKYCPRVMTVGGLSLSGTGNNITATIPMNFYLLVEAPPGAAAPAAGPGGIGGPGVPGPPGMTGPSGTGDGGTPAAPAPKVGKDDSGGDDAGTKPKVGKKGGDSGE